MKNVLILILSFAVSNFAIAGKKEVRHIVLLKGLNKGEGRYIRVDLTENGQYNSGYYGCVTKQSIVYGDFVYSDEVNDDYHSEKSIRFSLCQDETLTQCQEFATDKYTVFKNSDGSLETDGKHVLLIDSGSIKNEFKACAPNPNEVDMMNKFSRVKSTLLIKKR